MIRDRLLKDGLHGLRPLAPPDHAIWCSIQEGLRQGYQLRPRFRPAMTAGIGSGQLHPTGTAGEQLEQGLHRRMIDRERIDELPVVVENDRARKLKEPVDEIRELASIRLKIDVPAKRRYSRCDRFECVPSENAMGHLESDSADAGSRELLERPVGDVRSNDSHPARLAPEGRERRQKIRIVRTVRDGLDHDGARQPKTTLNGSVVLDARNRRRRRACRPGAGSADRKCACGSRMHAEAISTWAQGALRGRAASSNVFPRAAWNTRASAALAHIRFLEPAAAREPRSGKAEPRRGSAIRLWRQRFRRPASRAETV